MLKIENPISDGVITLSRENPFVWPLAKSEMAAVQIFVLKGFERKSDEWQISYDFNLSVLNETIVATIFNIWE